VKSYFAQRDIPMHVGGGHFSRCEIIFSRVKNGAKTVRRLRWKWLAGKAVVKAGKKKPAG